MTATATPRTAAPASSRVSDDDAPHPYHMTVDVFEKLVASGVFGDTSPIFLWRGRLVLPRTKGTHHEIAATELLAQLFRVVPAGWHIRQGSPLRIPDDSEPEPDLLIVRGASRDYKKQHPGPRDVALAVEVADSSLRYDAGDKRAAYAAAGIPVYWIVNLPRACVDVYSQPSGPTETPTFAAHQCYGPDDDVPVILDGVDVGRVPVREVLP